MILKDCKKGMKVRYIPTHAKGDPFHSDCENGIISSKNKKYVFVKYNNPDCIMKTGNEPYTAAATRPEDLMKRKRIE